MKPELTRRRVLAVIAGMGLAAQGVRAADAPVLEWHGTALGADATLIFASSNKEQAEEALAACLAEVDRLEQIFSLHIDTSEISQLNAHGVLAHPSFDMRALLTQSLRMHRLTGGLFDPTVQAIWDFRRSEVGGNVETVGAIPASVLANVGFEKIAINTDRVALEQGVSITLNGIAQGYITDRVADILHRRGWKNVLIDLGEARVLDGRPFDVVIGENGRKIALSGGALVTSSSAPLPVGVSATLPHLFNPRSGAAASRAWSTVSVAHASAAVADGLSTALMLCDGDEAQRARNILSGFPGARAWIVRSDLTEIEIAA